MLSVSSRALLEACARLGHDTDALLGAAGLSRAEVLDPDARLPVAGADALWRAAWARSGDPCLALHAAEALPFGAYKVLDYAMAASPTIGEGLRRVAAYFRLVDTRAELQVEERDAGLVLRMVSAGGALRPSAQEYTLAAVVLRSRRAAGQAWIPDAVSFAFPRPDDAGEHARIFGVTPRFGAEHPEVAVSRATWEAPSLGAEPALLSILDEHARALLDRLPPGEEDLVARTRAAIAAELRGGDPSIGRVARKLAMSDRTLQRRLGDAGVSYAALLDEVRRQWAEAYLRRPEIGLCEVAWLLGFAEQSSFTRAFRRWTGTSPGRFRQEAALGLPGPAAE